MRWTILTSRRQRFAREGGGTVLDLFQLGVVGKPTIGYYSRTPSDVVLNHLLWLLAHARSSGGRGSFVMGFEPLSDSGLMSRLTELNRADCLSSSKVRKLHQPREAGVTGLA